MKKLILSCAVTPLIFVGNALAQDEDPTRQDRALAAGYKAMFTCSATFNGDKTPEQIAQDELDNIYDDYNVAMAQVPDAEIDAAKKMVSVPFAYKEGFDKDTSQRTWSVAKSIAASVIGAAQQDGIIDVKDKAGLKAWSQKGDPRAKITVENLLQIASGLNSDPAGNRTDNVYFGGGLVVQNASKNPLEAPPGARWRYANNDTMLAMRSLREAMDNDKKYFAYPFKALLHKIGMYDTNPEMDWGGDFVMSSQVWTTARDLARLGTLYLNDGVWEGERVLPEGWANYVAARAPAQPENRLGEMASEPGRGYGAQFWRYENYPGVPNDTYAALGNRGQFLIIIPSRQTVIVRRGYDWRGNYFDGPAFAAAILETLE